MLKLHELKSRLQALSPQIEEEYKAKVLGVFGPHATETHSEESDVDLLVSFQESATLFDYIDLCEFLENEFNQAVDLVTEREVRGDMQDTIYNQLERI